MLTCKYVIQDYWLVVLDLYTSLFNIYKVSHLHPYYQYLFPWIFQNTFHINKVTNFRPDLDTFPSSLSPLSLLPVKTTCLRFSDREQPSENSSCPIGIPSLCSSTKATRHPEYRASKHTQLSYMVHVQRDQWIQALPTCCQHLSQRSHENEHKEYLLLRYL